MRRRRGRGRFRSRRRNMAKRGIPTIGIRL